MSYFRPQIFIEAMKKIAALTAFVALSFGLKAQNNHAMKWYNEPKKWADTNNKITVTVDPATDY